MCFTDKYIIYHNIPNKRPCYPVTYNEVFHLSCLLCCWSPPPQKKGKRLSKYITLLVPIHLNHPNVCIVCNVHKEMNQKSAIIKREHKTKEVGLFVHKVEALVLKVKCRQIFYYERLN